MKRNLEFEKDRIVVGGCIRALLYASLRSLPVVYSGPLPPFRFDLFPCDDLTKLNIDVNETTTSREIWEKLIFLLGLSGLVLVNEMDNTLRVKDKSLTVSSGSRVIKYNFNKLVIFDDEKITGLPRVTKEEKRKNTVIDWVNVRSGCRHGVDYLESDEQFIKEIFFYTSGRLDSGKLKDLVAISYLTDEELKDFDFSDTMAKFKIIKMMKAAGIRGARNGRDQLRPDRYKYYAIKVEPAERQVFSNSIRYYKPDDRFEFCYDSIEQIVENGTKPTGFFRKLCEAL